MPAPVIRSQAAVTNGTVTAASSFTTVSGPGAAPLAGDHLVAFIVAEDYGFTGCAPNVGVPVASAGWSSQGTGETVDLRLAWGAWSRTASGTSADNLSISGFNDPSVGSVLMVACVFNVSAVSYGTWSTHEGVTSPATASVSVPTADLVIPFFGADNRGSGAVPTFSTPSGYSLVVNKNNLVFDAASMFSKFTVTSGTVSSTVTGPGATVDWVSDYAAFTGSGAAPTTGSFFYPGFFS